MTHAIDVVTRKETGTRGDSRYRRRDQEGDWNTGVTQAIDVVTRKETGTRGDSRYRRRDQKETGTMGDAL